MKPCNKYHIENLERGDTVFVARQGTRLGYSISVDSVEQTAPGRWFLRDLRGNQYLLLDSDTDVQYGGEKVYL